MLVLAIETSCRRGSVALVESNRTLADAWHDEANAHGERLIGLIDEVFARAQRRPVELDRVAVGRGPGTFTGLRVGLALAQGIASGLHVPSIGVSSLRAMAEAMPVRTRGNRWPILDARRSELFLACYGDDGAELLSPRAVPRPGIADTVRRLNADLGSSSPESWLLGQVVSDIPEFDDVGFTAECGFLPFRSDATDWPGAAAVGRLASNPAETAPASPQYLRDADAIRPSLPPCPLDRPEEAGRLAEVR